MRVKFRAVAVMAAVLVVAGCTVKVAGSASPVPGQGPVKTADACSLLDPGQVDALDFEAGKPQAARPEQRVPPSCDYVGKGDATPPVIMSIVYSTDITLDQYLAGAVPKGDPQQLGGLSWTRYASIIGSECDLYVNLGEKSFVAVTSSVGDDDTKACEVSKRVAPVVAAHLPGGAPAPSITPTSSAGPEPDAKLAGFDPCTALTADQVKQLKLGDSEKDNSKVIPNSSFCLWHDTDGDRGQKAFEVWLGPTTPEKEWPGADVPPTETIDAGGKKWSLFPNASGSRVNCQAVLKVTDTSSVQIVSGYLDDDSKSCDLIKQGIPLVSANLPS